jgi:hypothetical protein
MFCLVLDVGFPLLGLAQETIPDVPLDVEFVHVASILNLTA